MFNRINIIGSLWEIKELSNKDCYLKVSTTRPFIGESLKYEKDFINVIILKEYYIDVKKFLKLGMMLAIEGRIESESNNNSKTKPRNFVLCETFFSLCREDNHISQICKN